MEKLRISLKAPCDNSYDIIIGAELLSQASQYIKSFCEDKRAIIISDAIVADLYLEVLQNNLQTADIVCDSVICRGFEAAKSLDEYSHLAEEILALQPSRKTLIIALGGGICGDLGGFLAATLLRGLPFIQIPTSLLAQVDSAVGGKVGLNSRQGKNLLGAFYQPKLVLCDMTLLQSLPLRQLQAGYAEILKYALINDPAFFAWLDENASAILNSQAQNHAQAIAHAVKVSCRKKTEIVSEDEKETGQRALLNLGHTFAHAFEACRKNDDELLHGEAVLIGLDLAFRLSVELKLCPLTDLQKLQKHLQKLHLPPLPDAIKKLKAAHIIKKMQADKKTENGTLRFILTRGIGKAFITSKVPNHILEKIMQNYLNE